MGRNALALSVMEYCCTPCVGMTWNKMATQAFGLTCNNDSY